MDGMHTATLKIIDKLRSLKLCLILSPVILSLQKDHRDLISLKRRPVHNPFSPSEDAFATPRKRKRAEMNNKFVPDDFDRQEGPSTPSPKRPKAAYEPHAGFSDDILLTDSDIEAENIASPPGRF